MKRFAAILLVFVLVLTLLPTSSSAASGSLSNFKQTLSYMDGQFQDVAPDAWYASSVKKAFELELVKGTSTTSFSPAGTMTIAQTITLASRLHSIYMTGSAAFEQTDVWYQVYVDYALANQIIEVPYSDYSLLATRSEFAEILANSLPKEALNEINTINDDAIPDVSSTSENADCVYLLYRAGILTGSDKYGTFQPTSTITRSEVAAIVTRMVDKSLRKQFVLAEKPVDAASVSLSKDTLPMYPGSSESLRAHILPAEADQALTWTSSNSNVASVDHAGRVTALSEGSAVITASTANGLSAKCTVTVTKRPSIGAPTTSISYSNGQKTMSAKTLFSDGSGLGFYRNSVNGICVTFIASNQSGKTINYFTCYFTMYNAVGDLVYDEVSRKAAVSSARTVGPIINGDSLVLTDSIIGYSGSCSKIVLDKIYLEYADGTTETVSYGYSGGKTAWHKYWNRF